MTLDTTVAFIDLSRFTMLNDVHGDGVAVDVLDRFISCVEDSLRDGAELVKTLGDGALLRGPDPRTLVGVMAEIVERFHDEDAMPDLSGGIHHGPVVQRGGDVLGRAVNLASRLADAAPPTALYATREVAEAAGSVGLEVEPLGALQLRGFVEAIDVFAVRPCPTDGHAVAVDPVCGMRINPGDETPRVVQGDRTAWFCSGDCERRFTSSPDRYPRAVR